MGLVSFVVCRRESRCSKREKIKAWKERSTRKKRARIHFAQELPLETCPLSFQGEPRRLTIAEPLS
ncbi:MAG: hypothetical protein RDV48_02925 [Candidatus Eremiobacteraeota bacterium]|nr:hypothetical protein [Candidatus Eremiobacteraeota bacterium]